MTKIEAPPLNDRRFSEPRKVTLDTDVSLHYVERGEGEPIIFIHRTSADWRGKPSSLARTKKPSVTPRSF